MVKSSLLNNSLNLVHLQPKISPKNIFSNYFVPWNIIVCSSNVMLDQFLEIPNNSLHLLINLPIINLLLIVKRNKFIWANKTWKWYFIEKHLKNTIPLKSILNKILVRLLVKFSLKTTQQEGNQERNINWIAFHEFYYNYTITTWCLSWVKVRQKKFYHNCF